MKQVTPLEKYGGLARKIGVEEIFFKREDLNPYGSHKGRSIPVMIDAYLKKDKKDFALSSSGNAALAAALYVKEINSRSEKPVSLDIFVGKNVNEFKFERLKKLADQNIKIFIKERPLMALTDAINEGKISLRQSTDDTALLGYESLAKEILETKNLGAVFIGTSSGTTAQALAQSFLNEKKKIQVHIVQTSSCHKIADELNSFDLPEEKSIADAIVDQTAYRKDVLAALVRRTKGSGWCATNENIEAAQELVKKETGLDISTNSALSVAGLMQAVYIGYEIKGGVVCLIAGA